MQDSVYLNGKMKEFSPFALSFLVMLAPSSSEVSMRIWQLYNLKRTAVPFDSLQTSNVYYFTIHDTKDRAPFVPLSTYISIKLPCKELEISAQSHPVVEHYIKSSGRLCERLSRVILAHQYSRWRKILLT